MQPIKFLQQWLEKNTDRERYLFATHSLRILFPDLSDSAFRGILNRAVKNDLLTRVCRGVYLYKKAMPHDGLLLFHVVNILRSSELNYISLETALSDVGAISQVPIAWITIMSSGRSSIIPCGNFGSIEFVHTNKKAGDLTGDLVYDDRCGLWRAKMSLTIKDMKRTGRSLDLIDWEIVDELI